MTDTRPGHGLDEYLEKLAKIPKEVHVNVNGTSGSFVSDAEFDRRVRQANDRAHRRAVIGQS